MTAESVKKVERRLQGRRLKQARIAAGYETAKAAALANGWVVSTFQQQEAGRRGLPISLARDYAFAFAVNVGWLLSGIEPRVAEFPPSMEEALSRLIDGRIAHAMRLPAKRWKAQP